MSVFKWFIIGFILITLLLFNVAYFYLAEIKHEIRKKEKEEYCKWQNTISKK